MGAVLATGIRSGILFQFDPDEFAHAQVSYLLLHGYIPYRQFFMTYTPLFHLTMAPVFWLSGYTMYAMTMMRWCMAALFLLRILLAGWLALRIFGKRIAALFLLLFLLNPFTVYTSMQMRPDNLMMLLFTAGLVVLVSAFEKRRLHNFFWSGALLSTSALVLMKIAPSIAVIGIALCIWAMLRRRWQYLYVFVLGCILPVLIFFLSTTAAGTTNAMFRQVFRDSYAINQSVAFPIPLTHYYESGNPALFDLYGSGWVRLPYVEQTLLILGAIGILIALFAKATNVHHGRDFRILHLLLAGALIAQAASLIFVHSVFIQYFLPITWLVDLFAAVAIGTVVQLAKRWKLLWIIAIVELIIFLSVYTADSVRANIERSHSTSNSAQAWVIDMWNRFPEDAIIYPNIPFRPLAYPLTFGYYFHDLPVSVTSRLSALVPTLEQHQVQYLVETYEWKALPADFFPYVSGNYHQIAPDEYIRNEKAAH